MEKSIIQSDHAPAPIGPYSQAILKGNTLFVSGQVAIDPVSGAVINQTIEAETHQVMKNIGAVLKAAEMGYSQVVKTSIFVTDLEHFASINEVYGSYFKEDPPARETVEVSRLPKDVNVEISCIAMK